MSLAAGHFEQNQQKFCKKQSNGAHISNIFSEREVIGNWDGIGLKMKSAFWENAPMQS